MSMCAATVTCVSDGAQTTEAIGGLAEGTSRRLIVFGVREYPGPESESDGYTEGFDEQMAQLQAWWCDPWLGEEAFEFVLDPLSSRADVDRIVERERLLEAGPDDVLFVYVTGHGDAESSTRHFILMPDASEKRPLIRHLRTAELVETIFASEARHVVIFVNACFGNSVTEEVRQIIRELGRERREVGTLAVVAMGDFDDRPRVREAAEVLRRAHEQLLTSAGIAREHITLDEFLTELARAAASATPRKMLLPTKIYPQIPTLDATLALPNPGFKPPVEIVDAARREVSASAEDVEYWLDRASGRTTTNDPGWYFSGRRELTRRIAEFLRASAGLMIVTGAAGSGKSALLARTVTLTDPRFLGTKRFADLVERLRETEPETIPPEGAVDVAVLARNRNSLEVLRAIADGIGVSPAAGDNEGQALRDAIADRAAERAVVVVLDGLDEAIQPELVVMEVLGPLGNLSSRRADHGVRFLIGLRSSGPDTEPGAPRTLLNRVRDALAGAEELRTDEDPKTDIGDYVSAVLQHPDSPYLDRPEEARNAGKVIAESVEPSFLDARFAARKLREKAEPQDLTDRTWLDSLAEGTWALLRDDLGDPGGLRTRHRFAVMRASAFALGRGVPWADVWPAMAEAVLDEEIPNAAGVIADVLGGRLMGYLAQDVEDDRIVYRPVHERLAQQLRDTGREP